MADPSRSDIESFAAQVEGQYGIPLGLLRGLIGQTSGYDTGKVSSKGERGLTQFMPKTAVAMNIDLNDWKSQVDGGARYLTQLQNRFGDWALALTAYKGGQSRLSQFMKGQLTSLPDEMVKYAPAVFEKAKAYGNTATAPVAWTDKLRAGTTGAVPSEKQPKVIPRSVEDLFANIQEPPKEAVALGQFMTAMTEPMFEPIAPASIFDDEILKIVRAV